MQSLGRVADNVGPVRALGRVAGRRVLAAAVAGTLLAAGLPGTALAAPGHLDPTFAAGTRTVDVRSTDDFPRKALVRSTGEIVVGEASGRPGSADVDPAFAQLTATGAPDASFGDVNGHVVVDLGFPATLQDFAIASDGKIVGLASALGQAVLFRLNRNGSLDTDHDADPAVQFSLDGIAVVGFPFDRQSWTHVALQANGRVVIAGGAFRNPTDTRELTALARFSATGVVDGAFAGGSVAFALGAGSSEARAVAIAPAGDRIVVASGALKAGHAALGVARLRAADGALDTTFSADGKLTTQVGQDARPEAVAVQSNGRIVVGATETSPQPQRAAFVRYTTAGALDSTFSGDGIFDPGFSNDVSLRSVHLTSGGKVVAFAGGAVSVVRLTVSGAFDPTMDGDGRLSLRIQGNNTFVAGGALAPGNLPVVLWDSGTLTAVHDAAVSRLTTAGAPDVTFAPAGTARYGQLAGSADVANEVAVTSAGKIVMAGWVDQVGGNRDLAVLRLTSAGYRDVAFNNGGWATMDLGTTDDAAFGVAVAGAKVVAVGCTTCSGIAGFAVARFTSAGIPDATFSGDGRLTTPFGSGGAEIAEAAAVQGDRKTVAAGLAGPDFAVARYTTTGALDSTFSGDGKVTTDIDAGSLDQAFGVVIQPDGKIVVAGLSLKTGVIRFAVARYTTAGALDLTFSGDGKLTTQFGALSAFAQAVALRPDGRILVAGVAYGTGDSSVAIARYGTGGALDATFSGDGMLTADFDAGPDQATGIASVANNGIVIGGFGGGGFLVARFLAGGALDGTFNGQGYRYTGFGGPAYAHGMALQPDGRIVLAGEGPNILGDTDMAIARYDP